MDEKLIESKIEAMLEELTDILTGYHRKYQSLFDRFDILVLGSHDEPFAAVVLHYHVGDHCERIQSVFSPECMLDDEYASGFTTSLACMFTAPVRFVVMHQTFPDEYHAADPSD